MRQSLSLGSTKIYFYGIFISLGCLAGYFLSKKRLKVYTFSETVLDYSLTVIFFFSVIGARLYHVLSSLSYYRKLPEEIFLIRQGGWGIFGGIFFGLIALILVSKIQKVSFMRLLDLFSLPLLITQAIGRLGNYFNREVFGPPTSLPWKIYVQPNKRPINFLNQSYFHPTFFYESIFCFLAGVLLYFLEKKYNYQKGFSAGFYFLSYGLIRFFTEFFRFDTWLIYNFKVAQGISLVFILTGIYLITNGIRKQKLVK